MLLTIDRYIIRVFFGGFVILVAVGMGMYVLGDLLFNGDEFTGDGEIPTSEVLISILDYYFFNLPLYFSQLAPPMMAVSAAFTLGLLMRNNETTALVASGMPLQRLVIPIAICAAILLPLIVANREIIIPRIAGKVARQRNDATGVRTQAARCIRDEKGAVLTARKLDPKSGVLEGLYLIEPATPEGNISVVQADQANWDAAANEWILTRGVRQTFTAPAENSLTSVATAPVAVLSMKLSPGEMTLRKSSEWSDLLSTRQLRRLAKGKAVPNRNTIMQSLFLRFSEPINHLILLALAVPAFLSRERKNVITSGGTAVMWTGLFYVLSFVARELIGGDVQSAQLAAGLPIIIFAPLAFLLLLNVKT
ncbi:MAG: LptF/LptG family permease [Phycisphaerae bacterium]